MDHLKQQALAEAMHLADIRGSHMKKESTANEVVEDAEKFYKFLFEGEGVPG